VASEQTELYNVDRASKSEGLDGLPVRIIVNRDLVLGPYRPMFFNRGAIR